MACLVPAPGHRHVTLPALPLWRMCALWRSYHRTSCTVNFGTLLVSKVAIWQHLIVQTATCSMLDQHTSGLGLLTETAAPQPSSKAMSTVTVLLCCLSAL